MIEDAFGTSSEFINELIKPDGTLVTADSWTDFLKTQKTRTSVLELLIPSNPYASYEDGSSQRLCLSKPFHQSMTALPLEEQDLPVDVIEEESRVIFGVVPPIQGTSIRRSTGSSLHTEYSFPTADASIQRPRHRRPTILREPDSTLEMRPPLDRRSSTVHYVGEQYQNGHIIPSPPDAPEISSLSESNLRRFSMSSGSDVPLSNERPNMLLNAAITRTRMRKNSTSSLRYSRTQFKEVTLPGVFDEETASALGRPPAVRIKLNTEEKIESHAHLLSTTVPSPPPSLHDTEITSQPSILKPSTIPSSSGSINDITTDCETNGSSPGPGLRQDSDASGNTRATAGSAVAPDNGLIPIISISETYHEEDREKGTEIDERTRVSLSVSKDKENLRYESTKDESLHLRNKTEVTEREITTKKGISVQKNTTGRNEPGSIEMRRGSSKGFEKVEAELEYTFNLPPVKEEVLPAFRWPSRAIAPTLDDPIMQISAENTDSNQASVESFFHI